MTVDEIWRSFYAGYLKPIIDIERTDRDDVFKKSNKFDRPDFGSNIPFELYSALTNLQLSNREHDSNIAATDSNHVEQQESDTTDTNHDDDHAEESDANKTTEDQGKSEEKNLSEFSYMLKHQRSLEEQVIETKQDNDLAEEMEKNRAEGAHQSVEEVEKADNTVTPENTEEPK